jgi:hypothetical protein
MSHDGKKTEDSMKRMAGKIERKNIPEKLEIEIGNQDFKLQIIICKL